MRPFTVLLGIVLGSLFSVSFSLAAVLLVFWILRNDHPRFAAELPELVRGALLFTASAGIAALAFLGTVRRRFWRYPVLGVLWASLGLVGWYYWPV